MDLACGETQEEHLWNLTPRRSDDYDGANGDSASAGVVQSTSSIAARGQMAAAALEWSAEFPLIRTNQERGVQNLGLIPQQTHSMLTDHTSGEANDIVANLRKNTLEAWRRPQKSPNSTAGGRKKNLLRTIVSAERCSLLELQAGMGRRESAASQYEENSKNKMNDEIKLAGLEALAPEELE